MARVLITGGTGFLGSYLSRFLTDRGDHVTGTYLLDPDPFLREVAGNPEIVHLDVRDPREVAEVLGKARPDAVYHLAGQPFVRPSWDDPTGTFRTNVDGTVHLLEWIRLHAPGTKFGFAGSSAAYGIAEHQPIREDAPLRPSSPYGSSKAAADVICYQYCVSYAIPIFRFRIFATTGPGKTGDAPNDFATQVAHLERAAPPRVLKVGSLETRRDFSDVRDTVRGLWTIVEKGTPGEAYNIGSGVTRSMRGIVEGLRGLAKVPVDLQVEDARLRRVDEPVIHAEVDRLRALGWSSQVPWERTLNDLLEHWRAHPGSVSLAPQ
ncbi:MAG: GDP-mannose 4,6-dehydratase [Thermoplasmata archaeon]|nr:GDP-mannose 4,6-dehydratase [Thermoplasmata archaeon]